MGEGTMTHMEKSDDFPMRNLFMTFHYEDDVIARFGYVITDKAFYTFVGSNQPKGTKLIEEDVEFPSIFMRGDTRRALVHYLDGKRFACYVPVFPTKDEVDKYSMGFNKRSK